MIILTLVIVVFFYASGSIIFTNLIYLTVEKA